MFLRSICYFWHPTHARTTRYEEAFLPEGKKRPHYYENTRHNKKMNNNTKFKKIKKKAKILKGQKKKHQNKTKKLSTYQTT